MGRSAAGSPYSAPKAPNVPQGTNDYSYLSGIYGASYGRKKAAADFTRPTFLARPVSPVENLITTVADRQPKPDTSIGTGSGREGIFRPDVAGEETPPSDMLATQTEVEGVDYDALDQAFEDYFKSDDYVQTTAGTGSTTMEDAAADPFDTSVTTMDDVPTMEEGIADTSGGMLDEDPEDVVMTGDEVPTMDEAIADTTDDVVITGDEVPTMDEYLASVGDQDAQDRVKFEDLLQANIQSGEGLLSISEYNNLIQNRITALSESTMTVTADQLREEQLEIERLQGLTEQNALETAYQDYVDAYNVANTEYILGENIFTLGDPADNPVDPTLQPSDEGLTRDEDEVTVISDPPKPEDEVVTTPEETESTVPDEPESVVLDPVEEWYTENYPELQKQITDQYNQIKEFLEGEGLEEGTLEFNAELEKATTYQALIAQRSGLYFMEVLLNP